MQTDRQCLVRPPSEEETVLLTRNPFLDEYVKYEKLGVAEIHKCGFVIGKSNTYDIHRQHVHQNHLRLAKHHKVMTNIAKL